MQNKGIEHDIRIKEGFSKKMPSEQRSKGNEGVII